MHSLSIQYMPSTRCNPVANNDHVFYLFYAVDASHLNFNYDLPVIVSYSLSRSLEGGTFTVIGSNFGADSLPSLVRIGTTACSSPTKVTDHTAFKCISPRFVPSVATPSSQGLLFNATFGSIVATSTFNYDVPAITGLSSSRSTAGGSITIFGSNFGMPFPSLSNSCGIHRVIFF